MLVSNDLRARYPDLCFAVEFSFDGFDGVVCVGRASMTDRAITRSSLHSISPKVKGS